MNIKRLLCIKIFLFCLFSHCSIKAEVLSRNILALYNSDLGHTPVKNHIHKNAETILNHLGCVVDYWDIKNGLPDQKYMQKYLGIIAWFYGEFTKNPFKYYEWASQQISANRKFVLLGQIGDFEDNTVKSVINNFCKKLGFIVGDDWTDEPNKIELIYKDSKMVEFERTLNYDLNYYFKLRSINPENKIYLKLKRKDKPNSESDFIIITPHGGFASSPYVLFQDSTTYKKKWRINPFKFFEEAFELKKIPKPDVTTLNGSRIWCSHIDGDAFISTSEIKPNATCGQIIRDDIIKPYKWPVSVSVIVGEIERDPKFVEIARSIFQIKWVEAASHSYAHPFYWADDYDEKDKYEARHMSIEGYTFDLKKEIIGSVNYINKNLLPIGKKVKQFFWTGNCQPTPEALKLCEEIKIKNINGGDTVFDNEYQSYTGVAPIGARVGGYRQVYSPNSNENIYTHEWKGPFYGYKLVMKTFKNTESPIRIKPINIYYHFYSGERWASLNALKEVLNKTMLSDVAPMFISEYLDIVDGFYSTQIEKISPDMWKVKNYGSCTTIRFDQTQKYPDFKKSSGILGYLHYQGSLYLHLENKNEAVIALTESEPKVTYLEQGSHRIFNWHGTKSKVSFLTEGFGQGKFVIVNVLKNRKYKITINDLDSNHKIKKSDSIILRSDPNGKLLLLPFMNGRKEIRISLISAI